MRPNNSFKFLLLLISAVNVYAQVPTSCAVTAVPTIVHSEGVAERLGDISLQCTGTPGVTVTANLNIQLPVAVTNNINSSGYSTDASLYYLSGTSTVPSGVAGLVTNQSISFNGFQFTFPPSGSLSVVVDDIRADANQLGIGQSTPIQAFLGSTLLLSPNPVTVANTQQGLLATNLAAAVTCVGSPTPSTISLTNLFAAGTAEQTTRVTEGFPTSFEPIDSTSTQGTRFLLTYSGIPAGATIYVPDAVAGSSATVPTAGGDMGTPATVGQYTLGSSTLLLVRVLNTDSTGTGGAFATLPAPNGSGVLVLDGANPVPLTSGSGYAVYEVVDADPSATESAQIPNFFAIAANSPASTSSGTVSLAPVSTVATASSTAPIPRFVAVTPPSDCTAESDCNALYYPLLKVTTTGALQATAVTAGPQKAAGVMQIGNVGGGVLDWSASITYTSGSGWASLNPSFGVDNTVAIPFVTPGSLPPGTYQATIVISGGPQAGTQSFPITMTVTAPAPPAPAVTITSITDAADFHAGPVVPGSLAAVFGSNFAGQNVSVTFNATPATLIYTGAAQINVRIPPSLTGQNSAQMVVTVDNVSSAPFTVPLTAIAPAVFTPGVLNQDNTINSSTNPAALGSVLQIFGTGMPDSGGAFKVTIQNQGNLTPQYAGAAPGLLGLEQVNVAVPANLQAGATTLTICVIGAGNQPYCSQPESITLKP